MIFGDIYKNLFRDFFKSFEKSPSQATEKVKMVLDFEAKNLPKMDIIGKTDAYFEVWSGKVLAFKSKVITNDINPTWKGIEFAVDKKSKVFINVYDHDKLSKNELIGTTEEFSVSEFAKTRKFDLMHKGKVRGSITCSPPVLKVDQNNKHNMESRSNTQTKVVLQKSVGGVVSNRKQEFISTPKVSVVATKTSSNITAVTSSIISTSSVKATTVSASTNISPSDQKTATKSVQQTIRFVASANNLPKMDFGINAKADPYFKILIFDDENVDKMISIYTSEIIKKNLAPKWDEAIVKFDKNRLLIVEIWDQDFGSKDDLIGKTVPFKLEELLIAKKLNLVITKKEKRRGMFSLELA